MYESYDYLLISRELLKAVRKGKSQSWLNQKIGYQYNQVSRWESGQKRIKWNDFVLVCRASGVNLFGALLEIGYLSEANQIANGSQLVQFLIGMSRAKDVSQITGISKDKLSRWVGAKSDPTLEEVLLLIDKCKAKLLDFVYTLVDRGDLEMLHPQYEKLQNQRRVYFEYPFVAALPRFFEVKAISANSDEEIEGLALALGTTKAELQSALQLGVE